MEKRVWRVTSDAGTHIVELRYSRWTGNGPLTVDGHSIPRIAPLSDLPLPVGDRDVVLQPLMDGFFVDYDLLVAGRSMDTGLPAPLAKRLHWRNWIAGVELLVVFALIAAALAAWLSVVELRYERSGQVANGSVVRLREEDSANWGLSRYVAYRFSTADRRVVDGESEVNLSTYRQLELGAPVSVQYLSEDATWNRLEGQNGWEGAQWVGAVALIIGGTALFVLVAKTARERTERRLSTEGLLASARIIAIVRRSVPADHWEIRYSYRDQEGRERQGKSWALRSAEVQGWGVGDRCRVRYDERDPANSLFVERLAP